MVSDEQLKKKVIEAEYDKHRTAIIQWELYKKYLERKMLASNESAWQEQLNAADTTLKASKELRDFYAELAKTEGITLQE